MAEPMTRREFVAATTVLGAGVALGAVSGCTGREDADKAEVPMPSTSYGGDNAMSKRVLVGYATGTGTTTGVADAIGKTLSERGFSVDVKPMKEQPSVEGYDAVVLGSAINGGQWLPEAVAYLEAQKDSLRDVPVSLFCVHAMNRGPDPKKTRKRLAYLDKERAMVTPVAEGFFAGKGPSQADANAFSRWAFRAFGGDVEGDERDWDAIRTWAEQVPV